MNLSANLGKLLRTGRNLHLEAQTERILMLKLIWQVLEPKAAWPRLQQGKTS